jgi:hypothetical protein
MRVCLLRSSNSRMYGGSVITDLRGVRLRRDSSLLFYSLEPPVS